MSNLTVGDQKFPPEHIDLAVAELRYQTAFYLEAVQAMMDGVTLGAESVQDKRLELLEVGPTTDPGAEILMIALTLVLEGTVGPAVAAVAVRAVLRPMMRGTARAILRTGNRSAFEKARLFRVSAASKSQSALLGGGLSSPQRIDLILEARKLRSAADLLKKDMRGRVGSAKPVRESINRIADFTENNLVAVAKAPLAVHGMPGSSVPMRAERPPGVSVLAAAMASASRLRLTAVATHEALEAELRHPSITVDDIRALLDDYRVDDQFSLADLREGSELATEAMIWASLLVTDNLKREFAERIHPIAPGSRGMDYRGPLPKSVDADKKLIAYLMKRFEREVERWASENSVPDPWWKGQDEAYRNDLLAQYLSAVSDGTPSGELNLQ